MTEAAAPGARHGSSTTVQGTKPAWDRSVPRRGRHSTRRTPGMDSTAQSSQPLGNMATQLHAHIKMTQAVGRKQLQQQAAASAGKDQSASSSHRGRYSSSTSHAPNVDESAQQATQMTDEGHVGHQNLHDDEHGPGVVLGRHVHHAE